MTTYPDISASSRMMQMISGFWTSCCIHVAAKLGLADQLAQGSLDISELAELNRCDAGSLHRVMRALASKGVFLETDPGTFANTLLSDTLRNTAAGSMRAMAISQLGDHFPAWGNLMYSVKTGRTAFDRIEGMELGTYYETHPDEGMNFHLAMKGLSDLVLDPLLSAYDFSPFGKITEIGGGRGRLLISILGRTAGSAGVIYDEDPLLGQIEKEIELKRLGHRCLARQGNILDAVPPGADAYLLNMVLHDRDDERVLRIFRNCEKAMGDGCRLLAIESVLPEGNEEHPGKFMDINMMAMTGGRERTEREFVTLANQAGLDLVRVIPLEDPLFSLLEIRKIGERAA
jgi:hypothetical protein